MNKPFVTNAHYPDEQIIVNASWRYDSFNRVFPFKRTASLIVCTEWFCDQDSESVVCKNPAGLFNESICKFTPESTQPITYYAKFCSEQEGHCFGGHEFDTSFTARSIASEKPFYHFEDEFGQLDNDWTVNGDVRIRGDILSIGKKENITRPINISELNNTVWQITAKTNETHTGTSLQYKVVDNKNEGFVLSLHKKHVQIWVGSQALIPVTSYPMESTSDRYHTYTVWIGTDDNVFLDIDGELQGHTQGFAINFQPFTHNEGYIQIEGSFNDTLIDNIKADFLPTKDPFLRSVPSNECQLDSDDILITKALTQSQFDAQVLSSFATCEDSNDKVLFARESSAVIRFNELDFIPEAESPNFTFQVYGMNNPTWKIEGSNNGKDFVDCGTRTQTQPLDTISIICGVTGDKLYTRLTMIDPKGSIYNYVKSAHLSLTTITPDEIIEANEEWDIKEDLNDITNWTFKGDESSTHGSINDILVLKTVKGQASYHLNKRIDNLIGSIWKFKTSVLEGSATYVLSSNDNKAFIINIDVKPDGFTVVSVIGPSGPKRIFSTGTSDFSETITVTINTSKTTINVDDVLYSSNPSNEFPIWEDLNIFPAIFADPITTQVDTAFFYANNGMIQSELEDNFKTSGSCTNQALQTTQAIGTSQVADASTRQDFSEWQCDNNDDYYLLSKDDYLTFSFDDETLNGKIINIKATTHSESGTTWTMQTSPDGINFEFCNNPAILSQSQKDQTLTWSCNSTSNILYIKLINALPNKNIFNYVKSLTLEPTTTQATSAPEPEPEPPLDLSAEVLTFTGQRNVQLGSKGTIASTITNPDNQKHRQFVCTNEDCSLDTNQVLCSSSLTESTSLSCSFFTDSRTDPEQAGTTYYLQVCNEQNDCTDSKELTITSSDSSPLWDFIEEFRSLDAWSASDSITIDSLEATLPQGSSLELAKDTLPTDFMEQATTSFRLKSTEQANLTLTDGTNSINIKITNESVTLTGKATQTLEIDSFIPNSYTITTNNGLARLDINNKATSDIAMLPSVSPPGIVLDSLNGTTTITYLLINYENGGTTSKKTSPLHITANELTTLSTNWDLLIDNIPSSFESSFLIDQQIEIQSKNDDKKRVIILGDTDGQNIDISDLVITTNNTDNGKTIIQGLNLQSNQRKATQVQKVLNSERVCIRNAPTSSISEISTSCNQASEVLLDCDGNTNTEGLSCTSFEDYYLISGLTHSGIIETDVEPTPKVTPPTPSTGGTSSGGSSGGHSRTSQKTPAARVIKEATKSSDPVKRKPIVIDLPDTKTQPTNATTTIIPPEVTSLLLDKRIGFGISAITVIIILLLYNFFKSDPPKKPKKSNLKIFLILFSLIIIPATAITASPIIFMLNEPQPIIIPTNDPSSIECAFISSESIESATIHGPFVSSSHSFSTIGDHEIEVSCTTTDGTITESTIQTTVISPISTDDLRINSPSLPSELDPNTEYVWTFGLNNETPSVCTATVNEIPTPIQLVKSGFNVTVNTNQEQKITVKTVCIDQTGALASGFTQRPIFIDTTNSPPLITTQTLPDTTVEEPYTAQISVSNLEDDLIEFNLEDPTPEGLTIDSSTGILSWTPGFLQNGIHQITITVFETDNPEQSDTEQLSINVFSGEPVIETIELTAGENWVHFPTVAPNTHASDLDLTSNTIITVSNPTTPGAWQQYVSSIPKFSDDFLIEPTRGYLIEVNDPEVLEYPGPSRLTEVSFSLSANKNTLIGIPFETGMRYSDLKSVLSSEYVIHYLDKEQQKHATYFSRRDDSDLETNRLISTTESFILTPFEDEEFTITRPAA